MIHNGGGKIKKGGFEPVPVDNAPEAAPSPVAAAVSNAEPAQEEANVKYATAKQKEEIIRLLNNPVITRQEKTKMLLNINKLDEERAKQSIQKLKKVIEDREQEQAAAA